MAYGLTSDLWQVAGSGYALTHGGSASRLLCEWKTQVDLLMQQLGHKHLHGPSTLLARWCKARFWALMTAFSVEVVDGNRQNGFPLTNEPNGGGLDAKGNASW